MNYPRLFSPITINGMTLKNRLIMPAMHHLYTENGACTQRFAAYYNRKAEGGVGLLIVGACRFDDYGAKASCMSLADDSTVESWKDFTDGIHRRDCKVAVQLYHAGRYMRANEVPFGDHALAPSAVPSVYSGETAPAMTLEEIATVIKRWAQGAVRAKAAGFDAVEILGSAGYLISQFLSPVTNLREDEYGGSWENRCRFPLEVIRAVRAAVGPDYPIIFRLGGSDFIPGSNTSAEAAAFAPLAQAAGVDCFNVTGGWHETRVPQLTGELPQGGLGYLAAAIRRAVTVPVAASNRMSSPEVAEEALALGRADLISTGRALLADPDFPNKAREDRAEEIRPCVACNQGCLAHTFFEKPITCLANPDCGLEYLPPASASDQRVLVIGGGPAGCQSAISLAELGCQVTLWEKTEALGGQLRLAARVPGKGEFGRLIRWYETILPRLGVKVEYNKAFEGQPLNGFDRVVVAVGGTPNVTSLARDPGAVPFLTSTQVLSGAIPGKDVVVIGGSFVGCMTAQYLARRGSVTPEQTYHLLAWQGETPEAVKAMTAQSDRRVTVVERGPKVGYGFEPGTSWTVMAELARLGVKKHTATEVVRLTPDGVLCRKGEEKFLIPCDTVVAASGVHPDQSIAQAVAAQGLPVSAAGNCAKLGKAMEATRAGAALAR